jgi:shikimate kinase
MKSSLASIFLVGPMGAGKSTVGRHLAAALEMSFEDSDRVIEQRTGASIPLIFEFEGEEGFRAREHHVIDELTARRGIILATGGGAVLDADNRRALSHRGIVIYLHAPLELLLERTARDRNRPLLQTQNPAARLAEILHDRDPLYRSVADLVIETDRRPPRGTVREILRQLKLRTSQKKV